MQPYNRARETAGTAGDVRLTVPDIRETLTIKTSGTFDVDAADVSRKCGPVGANTMEWTIEATCANKLDPNGFLIDWRHIDAYFRETFGGKQPVFPSCEIIAREACQGLWALIRENGATPYRLKVEARAFGQNGIIAEKCIRPFLSDAWGA